MTERIFPCCIVLASLAVLSLSSPCRVIRFVSDCKYVIKCEKNLGPVFTPDCMENSYVTVIIANTSRNYLSWNFFMETNFDSMVREIKGVDNSWSIIDKSAFAFYNKCLIMDLSNNKIEQINAKAFITLSELRFLNLSNNNIESFETESFFISDSVNNDLKILDVSHNRLQYLGSELNEVPNLTQLNLQNNRLSSIADNAFLNLTNLRHLYLQHNLLTAVNSSLLNLKSLTTLDLSHNHLQLIAGYEINCLVALVNFDVSHNNLTYVPSNYFRQAFDLQRVDFSFNQISTTIQDRMFVNNSRLHFLDFNHNRLKKIRGKTFQYCNLSYFNLANNDISDDITEETLCNLRNIIKLDLSMQSITGIRKYAFTDMESLLYLNMSNNRINVVQSSSFMHTPITVLDLSDNDIPNLDFLKNCLTSLTELHIRKNNITVIPTYIFNNKTQIRILDLSMNHIIKIEENSLPLHNLKLLNLSFNHLSELSYGSVMDLTKMEILDLSRNKFSRLDVNAFINFNELRILFIDSIIFRTLNTYKFLLHVKKLRTLCFDHYLSYCYDIGQGIRAENVTNLFKEHARNMNTTSFALPMYNVTEMGRTAFFNTTTYPYITTDILNTTDFDVIESFYTTTKPYATTNVSNITEFISTKSFFNATAPRFRTSLFNCSKSQVTIDEEESLKELRAIREELVELQSTLANFTNAVNHFDSKIDRTFDRTLKTRSSSFKQYFNKDNDNNNVRIVNIPEADEKGFMHIKLSVDTKLDVKLNKRDVTTDNRWQP